MLPDYKIFARVISRACFAGLCGMSFLALLFGTASAAPGCKTKGALALKPAMVSRARWGAAKPSFAMQQHKISTITVHHSAVRSKRGKSLERKLKGLQAFSQRSERLASGKMKKAWADVPYHYYIGASGRIGVARSVRYAGDTNTNYNPSGHVQVVVEGNFQVEPVSAAQKRALTNLLAWLAVRYNVNPAKIRGHKHHAQTLCPGANLQAALPAIRKNVAARIAKTCH